MEPIPILLGVPRRAAARTAAAFLATAAVVLLAAACSSSPSSTGSGGSPNARGSASSGSLNSQLVAFSRCMRSHGVSNFPDPLAGASNEKFPSAQQLGVSNSRYQGSENSCRQLLPVGIDDVFPPAEVPLLLSGMREFSQCMRSHGAPDWPDPAVGSAGRPEFPLAEVPGHDRNYWRSPQVMNVAGECHHFMPSALGGIPVG